MLEAGTDTGGCGGRAAAVVFLLLLLLLLLLLVEEEENAACISGAAGGGSDADGKTGGGVAERSMRSPGFDGFRAMTPRMPSTGTELRRSLESDSLTISVGIIDMAPPTVVGNGSSSSIWWACCWWWAWEFPIASVCMCEVYIIIYACERVFGVSFGLVKKVGELMCFLGVWCTSSGSRIYFFL